MLPISQNRKSGSKWLVVATILSFCTLSTACNVYDAELLDPPGPDEYLLQPISVSHEVNFLPQSGELIAEEKKRLLDFIKDIDPKEEGQLWVDASGKNGKARRAEVTKALKHFGWNNIKSGAVGGRADNVIITAKRQVILPKACLTPSTWPDPRMVPASCSNALNLIASVENRGDLIEGRELGLASGGTAAAALRKLWDQPYMDTGGGGSATKELSAAEN